MLELAVKGAVAIGLVLVLVSGLAFVLQRSLLYFPWTGAPQQAPPGVEELALETDDGVDIGAWFVPAARSGAQPGPGVLVCNGNAGYRAHRMPLAAAMADLGYHVLLFDYRGYAGNGGSPSEAGLLADARAAAAALAARPEVDPERVAYFGESLGAAVCGGLAATVPPAALILRSPFPSTVEIARHHYPFLPVVESLIWDRYPLARQLRGAPVPVPLLVIVAARDEIVPPALSRRVYEAAAEPKSWVQVPASHHNDPALLDGAEMLAEISAFLGQED